MRQLILFPALLFSLFCSSCADKNSSSAADRPHAMVVMRDGTRLAGSVVESSPSEITLAGDDSVRRTIPMKQVKSIEYDDASQTAAAPGQKAPAHKPAPPQPQTSTKTITIPRSQSSKPERTNFRWEPRFRCGLKRPSIRARRPRGRYTRPKLRRTGSMQQAPS